MNVENGAEAVQFPEKEYVNGIAVAVHGRLTCLTPRQMILLQEQYQHSTGGSYVEKPAETQTIVYSIRPASH